jgi:hypothetical protein
MKKLLWFSRHKMSAEQHAEISAKLGGAIEITQVNGTAPNVHVPFESTIPEAGEGVEADKILLGQQAPLKELVKGFDEVAAVLPIGLQQQILPFLPAGRLLQALNGRVMTAEGKAQFVHQKWQAVTKIEVVTVDL